MINVLVFFFAFMTKVYDREVSIVLVTSILNQSLNLMKKKMEPVRWVDNFQDLFL